MIVGITGSAHEEAGGGGLSLNLVQQAGSSGNTSSGGGRTATFPSGATAGNLLVCVMGAFGTGATGGSTLADPSAFSHVTNTGQAVSSTGVAIRIARKIAIGGETSIEAFYMGSGTAVFNVEILEFSGASTWSDDKTSTALSVTNGTTLQPGSTGTLTSAPSVAVAVGQLHTVDAISESWNSSFNATTFSGGLACHVAWRIVTNTTALNPTLTIGSSRGWAMGIATFTAA